MNFITDTQGHLLMLMAGYVLSLFLGGSLRQYCGLPLRRFVHKRIRILGERLNQRDVATRVWRGLIVIVLLLIPCLALDWVLGSSGLFAAIIIGMTADIQPTLWHGWSTVAAAKGHNEPRMALAAATLALEPSSAPDRHGIMRLIILSLTHHFAIVLVGGAFWFGLLGLKGLLGYYVLATAAHYFREGDERWRAFGWAATRCFTLVDVIPSFLSAMFLIIASLFVPKANPFKAFKAYMDARDEHHARIIAASLSIALGGPRLVNGTIHQIPWIGEGTAQIEGSDMARFMTLYSIGLLGLILLILFIISL